LVAERGRLVSMPVIGVSCIRRGDTKEIYLGLSCALLHITTLQHAIELETAVLIDGRKGVDVEM